MVSPHRLVTLKELPGKEITRNKRICDDLFTAPVVHRLDADCVIRRVPRNGNSRTGKQPSGIINTLQYC